MPDFSGAQSIVSVGRYSFGDVVIERAYLADGKTFLERAVDTSGLAGNQIGIYKLTYEDRPASVADWEEFLGDGKTIGLIGQVNVTVPPAGQSYDRLWADGDDPVAPVEFLEEVDECSDRQHTAMAYVRDLRDGRSERLYFGKASDDNGSCIQLWTGVEIDASAIEVA